MRLSSSIFLYASVAAAAAAKATPKPTTTPQSESTTSPSPDTTSRVPIWNFENALYGQVQLVGSIISSNEDETAIAVTCQPKGTSTCQLPIGVGPTITVGPSTYYYSIPVKDVPSTRVFDQPKFIYSENCTIYAPSSGAKPTSANCGYGFVQEPGPRGFGAANVPYTRASEIQQTLLPITAGPSSISTSTSTSSDGAQPPITPAPFAGPALAAGALAAYAVMAL